MLVKDHHISDKFESEGHRLKVKVTKASLISEKAVHGQGHGDQGHQRYRSKVVRVKVVGQGHRVKVKFFKVPFSPINSQEVRHGGVFIYSTVDKSSDGQRLG